MKKIFNHIPLSFLFKLGMIYYNIECILSNYQIVFKDHKQIDSTVWQG